MTVYKSTRLLTTINKYKISKDIVNIKAKISSSMYDTRLLTTINKYKSKDIVIYV